MAAPALIEDDDGASYEGHLSDDEACNDGRVFGQGQFRGHVEVINVPRNLLQKTCF